MYSTGLLCLCLTRYVTFLIHVLLISYIDKRNSILSGLPYKLPHTWFNWLQLPISLLEPFIKK